MPSLGPSSRPYTQAPNGGSRMEESNDQLSRWVALKAALRRWPAISLMALVMATLVALSLTAPLSDGAAWWQAILSGVALLGSMLFWRLDKQAQALNEANDRAAAEAIRRTKFRSTAIIVLDDVLHIDGWTRELLRLGSDPDDEVNINGKDVRIVRSVPPTGRLLDEVPHLFHLGVDAAPLQRALFRYLQLENLLKEAHDKEAAVQAGCKLTKETFQQMLKMISDDLNVFLPLMHRALWEDEVAAAAFAAERAYRVAKRIPNPG